MYLYVYVYIYIYIYIAIYSNIYVYIYLLIEVAYGKVPLRAHRDGGMRRAGCLVSSSDALLKVSRGGTA